MKLLQKITEVAQRIQDKTGRSPGQLVFWPTFCLLVVIHCLWNTSLIYLDVWWLTGVKLLRYGLYVIVLFKCFFLTRYEKSDLFACALFLGLSGLSFFFAGDSTLLEFSLIVLFAKDMPARKLLMVLTSIKFLAVVLTISFSCIGILPTLQYQNGDAGAYNTFGFCHRNVLGANMVFLCLSWFYLRFRKISLWDLLLWLALSIVTYYLAVSRSSLLMMLAITAGMFLAQQMRKAIRDIPHLRKLICGFFLFLLICSALCTIFYRADSPFWALLDKFFTKRLRFANYCLENYGLSVFGQNLPFVSSMEAQMGGSAKLILDNAYMRVILYYGIIPGFCFLFYYFRCLDTACRQKNIPLAAAMLFFAVYGLSERFMLGVFYNFPLLIAGLDRLSFKSSHTQSITPIEGICILIQDIRRNLS